MEITQLINDPAVKEVVDSFKASCVAKTKFYDQLRGVVSDLAPFITDKMKLSAEDFKKAVEKYDHDHKFDSYQFRYNKKYTTAAIFVPVKDMGVNAHDTLTFKGRKADHPETLVFVASTQPKEDGEAVPEDRTVEIEEHLFISWLKNDMVH